MILEKKENHLISNFNRSSEYQIRVKGVIGKSWLDRFGGMKVTLEEDNKGDSTYNMVGCLNDQTALAGILKTLYELHLTILSIQILDNTEI
jgi:hypothetical protein